MRAMTHRRFIDVVRAWLRQVFRHTTVERNSADEFERFFGQ
jgi:hypothetical protein